MRHLNSKIIILLLDYKSGDRDEPGYRDDSILCTISVFDCGIFRRLSLSTMITMFWFLLLRSSAVRLYSKISNRHWLYGWNNGNRQTQTSTHIGEAFSAAFDFDRCRRLLSFKYRRRRLIELSKQSSPAQTATPPSVVSSKVAITTTLQTTGVSRVTWCWRPCRQVRSRCCCSLWS